MTWTSRTSRATTVAGLLFAAHLAIGAWTGAQRLVAHRAFLSSASAGDWWLEKARFGAAATEVADLLARVPPGDDVLLVYAPDDSRETPPWPFVSYLAWPRRSWAFHCTAGETRPFLWIAPRRGRWADPQEIRWVLFFELEPPARLRREGSAGRLVLAAADRAVPWSAYCSR